MTGLAWFLLTYAGVASGFAWAGLFHAFDWPNWLLPWVAFASGGVFGYLFVRVVEG